MAIDNGMATHPVYDFAPDRLPADVLQAIGYAVAAAAQAEFCLNAAIAGVAGVHEVVGMTLTTHMSMPMRFQALRSGGRLRWVAEDPRLKELEGLVSGLEGAFEHRNRFAHGSWAVDPSDGTTHLIKQTARRRLEMVRQSITAVEVRDAGDRLVELGHALMGFVIQNGLEVHHPRWAEDQDDARTAPPHGG